MTEAWHGKPAGYRTHKCTCDLCQAAHAKAQKSWRSKKYAQRVERDGRLIHPEAPHGTTGGYHNYGCRCVDCCRAVKARVAA